MVSAIILLIDGNIKACDIPMKRKTTPHPKIITTDLMNSVLERSESSKHTIIGEWNFNKDETLIAYGYIEGFQENNHELPPSLKKVSTTIYGDILLLKSNKKHNILNLTWSCWYPRNGKPCGRCIMCRERYKPSTITEHFTAVTSTTPLLAYGINIGLIALIVILILC